MCFLGTAKHPVRLEGRQPRGSRARRKMGLDLFLHRPPHYSCGFQMRCSRSRLEMHLLFPSVVPGCHCLPLLLPCSYRSPRPLCPFLVLSASSGKWPTGVPHVCSRLSPGHLRRVRATVSDQRSQPQLGFLLPKLVPATAFHLRIVPPPPGRPEAEPWAPS